jgi:Tfp pilus assembly protein PilZ
MTHSHMTISDAKSEFAEKRSNRRIACSRSADISAGNVTYAALIKNISIEGAFIETNAPFSVGQILLLSFYSPIKQKKIAVAGEIVRAYKQGFGLKFRY